MQETDAVIDDERKAFLDNYFENIDAPTHLGLIVFYTYLGLSSEPYCLNPERDYPSHAGIVMEKEGDLYIAHRIGLMNHLEKKG